MKEKITAASVAISQLMIVGAVKAANVDTVTPVGGTDLTVVLNSVITWILGIAGIMAVLMLIIGGVRYVISAGNPTQTEGAKKTIIYALVGIIVIILSYVLVNTVIGLF